MVGTNVEQARFNMIEQQVRPGEVLDPRVLSVLAEVPREAFVPEAFRGLAFADIRVPLGEGECMMSPIMEGRMLQALDVQPDEQVLEIGTGSGFVTACLARLGKEVVSVEIHESLATRARQALEARGVSNASVQTGDVFTDGLPQGDYDVIAVTGSLPVEDDRFRRLLKPGGRLFVIVGEDPIMEALLITRSGDSQWIRESLFDTEIPALIHAPQPQRFSF